MTSFDLIYSFSLREKSQTILKVYGDCHMRALEAIETRDGNSASAVLLYCNPLCVFLGEKKTFCELVCFIYEFNSLLYGRV